MAYSKFYFRGKDTEREFFKLFGINTSSVKEDNFEHWDVETSFGKVDVKGLKSISRGQPLQDKFIWIELVNVAGNPGWLYGDADYFAFRTFKSFLLTPKDRLQRIIEQYVTEWGDKPPVYKKYQRKGRNDILTLIPTIDIKKISYEVFLNSEEANKKGQ